MDFNFLSILASTLFTFHDHACDRERLRLRCPYGTTIRIQWAKYGRSLPSSQICPYSSAGWGRLGNSHAGVEDVNCLASTSTEIVLENCQDQRQCRIMVSAHSFGEDPCPGTSKYLEIAYRCRPNAFRSRIACEGDSMTIQCDPKMKIAVYSAMFGQSFGSDVNCPASPSYDVECQAACALEVVMRKCHGKKVCHVNSSTRLFGEPCQPGTPKYLSVVYACVSRRILREIKSDEVFTNAFCKNADGSSWDGGGGDGGGADSSSSGGVHNGAAGYQPELSTIAIPTTTHKDKDLAYTAEKPRPGITEIPKIAPVQQSDDFNFISDFLQTYQFISENEERLILYILLSVLTGVILVLLVIILRLSLSRRRQKKRAKLEITEPIPSHGTTPPKADQRPEDVSLLGSSEDPTLSTDGIEMLSFHQHQSTFSRNHYSTTPKTFGTPNNNNNHNHGLSHTSTMPHTPRTTAYSPPPVMSATLQTTPVYDDGLNHFRVTPSRTSSLPRRYESQGSRTYDNYYR